MIELSTLSYILSTVVVGIFLYLSKLIMVSETRKIKFILITPESSAPEKGTKFSAGYDLKSSENCVVAPRSRRAVKTGVKVCLPQNTYGRIASRSGLSFRNGIEVGAGVIDEDYQNELMVILHNHSDEEFVVSQQDRIAQLIVESIVHPITIIKNIDGEEQVYDACIRKVRGLGGFGSTGVQ